MASTNFKLFDENKSNMMSDADYLQNVQRLSGVQSGVASSQLQNKSLYQTTLMAYAIAQMMVANNIDANDKAAVSTFVSNLSRTILQKVSDKASAADISKGTTNKWVPSDLFKNSLDTVLKLSGGIMTGSLILSGDPTQDLEAATKRYVDKVGRYVCGFYVGNGKFGQASPTTLTFDFDVEILYLFKIAESGNIIGSFDSVVSDSTLIKCNNTAVQYNDTTLDNADIGFPFFVSGMSSAFTNKNQALTAHPAQESSAGYNAWGLFSRRNGNVIQFYCGNNLKTSEYSARSQFNSNGVKYVYFAFGK